MARAFGLDFGTTNTALALADGAAAPALAHFRQGLRKSAPVFRSVVYFERPAEGRGPLLERAGPRAIARFLGSDEPGRLIQSLKSFLAARDFTSTRIFERELKLESMIAVLLRAVRDEAEREFGPIRGRVVVGRPVRFVNASSAEDEALALARLRAALSTAGFEDVEFELEPVAAALHYAHGLARDERVLIGDFGGGTSDFSLLRAGPEVARRTGRAAEVLANAGVPLAGDVFDGRIVRHAIAPELGFGAEYRSIFGHVLPVPRWLYAHLERWHHLSFLKSPRTLQLLFDLQREALEPGKFEALIHVVRADLGLPLHRSVERAKRELSRDLHAELRFAHGPVDVAAKLERRDFEGWIAEELASLEDAVERLLVAGGVDPGEVDRVFLTGGSSLVPAVRQIFARRFGEEKIRGGGELTSVASGLALRAAEAGGPVR